MCLCGKEVIITEETHTILEHQKDLKEHLMFTIKNTYEHNDMRELTMEKHLSIWAVL